MKLIITEQQFNLLIESESKKDSKFFELIKKFIYDPKKRYPFNLWNVCKNINDWPDITYLDGYDENGEELIRTESLDLENSEILSLTKDKFIFTANGDWQPEHVVTVKLVGCKLKAVECRPYDKKKDGGKKPSKNDLLETLGVLDEYKEVQKSIEDKRFEEKMNEFIEEYNEWNMEDGKIVGYETPTESSVFEFIQNHHEQYNNNKKIQKELLKRLK